MLLLYCEGSKPYTQILVSANLNIYQVVNTLALSVDTILYPDMYVEHSWHDIKLIITILLPARCVLCANLDPGWGGGVLPSNPDWVTEIFSTQRFISRLTSDTSVGNNDTNVFCILWHHTIYQQHAMELVGWLPSNSRPCTWSTCDCNHLVGLMVAFAFKCMFMFSLFWLCLQVFPLNWPSTNT